MSVTGAQAKTLIVLDFVEAHVRCFTLARHHFHQAVSSPASGPNRRGPWQQASMKHDRRQQMGFW